MGTQVTSVSTVVRIQEVNHPDILAHKVHRAKGSLMVAKEKERAERKENCMPFGIRTLKLGGIRKLVVKKRKRLRSRRIRNLCWFYHVF